MTTPTNNGTSYMPTAGEGTVAQWQGVYVGTVVNNADPLGVGRLQLNVPQVLGNTVSAWAVPAGTYYTIPTNGTPVSVLFLGGDPSQPIWNGPLDLNPLVLSAAGPNVTYSSSAPANPKVGDIWYEVLGGVQAAPQVWTFNSMTSTYSWVSQPSLGNAAIAPDAVTGTTIAAGAIDGKVINGNTINAATINGSDINITAGLNNAVLLYSSAAPAYKQTIINTDTHPPTGTSTAYTSTAATTVGSAILVSLGIGAATTDLVTSVTDSKSNTYTRIQTEPGITVGRVYQYIALNTTALTTSDTITINYSSAPSNVLHIQAIEIVNVATASAVDTTNASANAAGIGPLSISSGTLGAAPEVIIGSWTSGAFGSPVITDGVFATAATQGGMVTTWVTANTTSPLTNTVYFNLFPGDGANAGVLVSLKNAGAPVLLGSGAALAGVDQYSNPFKEGFTVYHGNGRLQQHVNAGYGASGAPAHEYVTGVTSEASNAAIYTVPVNAGLVNESIQTNILGPASTHDNARTLVQLGSANADGSGVATGVIYMGVSGVFSPIWFWNAGGSQSISPGGAQWPVNGAQTDGTSHAAAASVTTAAQQIGKAYSIPASDSKQNTVYRYTIWGIWAQGGTAEAFTPQLAIAGTSGFGDIGIGSVAFPASHAGTFRIVWDFQLVTAPGSGAKWNLVGAGAIQDAGVNAGNTQASYALSSVTTGNVGSGGAITQSTLSTFTVGATCSWGGNGGGTITGYGTTFERLGQ